MNTSAFSVSQITRSPVSFWRRPTFSLVFLFNADVLTEALPLSLMSWPDLIPSVLQFSQPDLWLLREFLHIPPRLPVLGSNLCRLYFYIWAFFTPRALSHGKLSNRSLKRPRFALLKSKVVSLRCTASMKQTSF